MSNGDWTVPPQSLTQPPFAGPGTARIVIGPDLPPPLNTYLFYGTILATNGTIYYGAFPADDTYTFMVLVQSTFFVDVVIGHVVNGAVVEYQAGFPAGQTWRETLVGPPYLVTNVTTDRLVINGEFFIDLKSAARGLVDRISSAAGTAAIGAGETVVLTGGVMTWVAGRAYEVIESTDWSGTVASNLAFTIIRRNNVAGAVMGTHEFGNSVNVGFGQTGYARTIIRNNTGADISDNIVQTVQCAGGGTVTGAGGGIYMFLRYLETRDVGAAADFPNATQI